MYNVYTYTLDCFALVTYSQENSLNSNLEKIVLRYILAYMTFIIILAVQSFSGRKQFFLNFILTI